MKPRFSTLIFLTLITALILLPFAFSSAYLPVLRDRTFELYELLRGDRYKQITGFVTLALVLAEIGLTIRKRGRKWNLKIPGSVMLWRSLHIFVGVFLIAAVLIHTVGATGLNFNAIFLWVFFAVSLSALVGVVAETGVLETDIARSLQRLTLRLPNRAHRRTADSATAVAETRAMAMQAARSQHHGSGSGSGQESSSARPSSGKETLPELESFLTPEGTAKLPRLFMAMSKGPLIRGMRAIWLSAHIFLVSIFIVMLGFHIFLAYYFQ